MFFQLFAKLKKNRRVPYFDCNCLGFQILHFITIMRLLFVNSIIL